MLLCLAPGVGWGTACVVAEHNFRREAGMQILTENLTLPAPSRILRCRSMFDVGMDVSFRMAPADLDQLLAANRFTRLSLDDLDPKSGFRPNLPPPSPGPCDFYRCDNSHGGKCVLAVTRDHCDAILHVGG